MKKYTYARPMYRNAKPQQLRAFARDHLIRFGYLKPCRHAAGSMCSHLEAALFKFQSFTRLAPTGTPTLETIKLMSKPRCGVPDPVDAPAGSRAFGEGDPESDPFTYFGGAWDKQNLTWVLDSGTEDTNEEISTLQRAFDAWADHVPLSFTRTDDPNADILIGWITGDPTNNIIAFTLHSDPPDQSRIIFDETQVDWSDLNLFFETALHEIGHAIGLDHSGNPEAIMFAFVNGTPVLHEDDIRGARSRYPLVIPSTSNDFIRVPLFALQPRFTGTQAKTVDLGSPKKVIAWGQVTVADSLIQFDQDNAYAVEVFEIDGDRCPGAHHFGGDHFGSDGGPANVATGAWTGVAQTITFRIRATHVADLEVYGTGNIIILE